MATAAIAGTVDKVLSSAFPGLLKDLGMGVYNSSPVFARINKGNQKRPWEGESIQGALISSTYGKAASYQNDDTVDTTSKEPFTAFQFELGGYQTNVTLFGMQIRKVQSSYRKLFDLQKTETRLATIDMVDKMSDHLFQSTNDAKGILSLDTITDASTTIAGVAGSGVWGGTTTASGSFAAQGKSDLVTLYLTLSKFASFKETNNTTGMANEPNLAVTTNAVWQFYWNSLDASMRYTTSDTGDVMTKLAFMGMPIVQDQHVATGRLYMLNTRELYLYVMGDADFTSLAPSAPVSQPDSWSRGLIWNGQLVFSNRRCQGKLTGITA